MGFNVAARRNAVIADFLPEGLEALEFMTEDEVKESYTSYAKRLMHFFLLFLMRCRNRG